MSEARARFINPGTTPSIGWVYTILHEGVKYPFQAPMKTGLLLQLRKWYRDKQLDWPGDAEMVARIENYICQRLPKGFCKGGRDTGLKILSSKKIRDATRGFAYKALRYPDKYLVPLDEATRRAQVCANCRHNLHGICTSCAGNEFMDLFSMYERAGRTTPYDSVLDTCESCGCLIKTKVHISMELLSLTTKHHYPENCWLHGTPACLPEEPNNETQHEVEYPAP